MEREEPAENPFDNVFAIWAEQFKSRIRQHLIGGPGAESKPRESSTAKLEALQGRSEAEQLQEARTIIKTLERCSSSCLGSIPWKVKLTI